MSKQSNETMLRFGAKDMKWDKTLQAIRKGTTKDLGEIMFDPDSYKG